MKIKSTPQVVKRPDPNSNSDQADRPDIQTAKIKRDEYHRAVQERRKLKAAEYATKDPVRSYIKQKGDMVGRRIAHFQRKNPNQ